LSYAIKHPAINIRHIAISRKEMDLVDGLEPDCGKRACRLAFTLLCLAKYWDVANCSEKHWVNSKDSDIMRMANINTSIRQQSQLYHSLSEHDIIQFSRKVDNTSVRYCGICGGDPVLLITDLRNLGYQYLRYHGGPYFECRNCGITTKYNCPSNPVVVASQIYCKECAIKVRIQQNVNAVMRIRNRAHADSTAES
jgi:hypothetical protein